MNEQAPLRYTPPDSHDTHIRGMFVFLIVFFVSLCLLVACLVIFAPKIARHIPFSAEQRFVKPYEAAIKKFWGGSVSDDQQEIEVYLQGLAEASAKQMAMPSDIKLTVHYIHSDVVNAFATLGGHVFVFKGLLEKMPDENSLMMIMAHEVAHIKHRDPLTAMGRGFAIQMLYAFISGDYTSNADLLLDGGSELGLLYFSRHQEREADKTALNVLAQHYGHAQGFDSLFKLFLSIEKDLDEDDEAFSLSEDLLATHPRSEERIDYLEKQIEDEGIRLTGEVTVLPEYLDAWIENIETTKEEEKKQKRRDKLRPAE